MPGMGGSSGGKPKPGMPDEEARSDAIAKLEQEMREAQDKDGAHFDILRRRAQLRQFGAEDALDEDDGDSEFSSGDDEDVIVNPEWLEAAQREGYDPDPESLFGPGSSRRPASVIDGTENHSQDPDAAGPPFRQPRPVQGFLRAGEERRIRALRESPIAEFAPVFLNYLEHEAWLDSYRDGDSGGAFMDRTIAPWDEFCEEDAQYRNALTDDEYHIPEDYEEPVYVPDRIRSQIYFQWAHKGLSIAELASRYSLRSERVAAFILFKRTEPEYAARGMINPDMDKLMEGLYGAEAQGKTPMRDWDGGGDDHDAGLDLALLRDAQLPDDCYPRMKFRGNRVRGAFPTHRRPPIPVKERKFHSRYAIRDVSAGDGFAEQRKARHIIVDYDGERRPATRREELSQGTRLRRAYPKRVGYGRYNLPFEDDRLDEAAT